MINWKKNKGKVGVKIPYFYLILKSKGNIKNFLITKKSYELLKDSNLFDENYYLKTYPHIKKTGMDPLLHYIFFGNKEDKFPSLKFKQIYKSIKDSNLFDENYYLKTYPHIKKTGMDPLLHYILFGKEEEKLPSLKFDGNHYLETYNDVKKSNFNPLVHYALYGQKSGRIFKSEAEEYKFVKYSDPNINNILSTLKSDKIVIIIYINNDFENAEKSVSSILKNTQIKYELLLIDNFSTDKRIKTLFNKLKNLKNVNIIHDRENLGFIKNINLEIKNSEKDILLIKNGTIVTTRWLQKLIVAAYSDEKIGTVIPLSNFTKFLSNIIAKTEIKQLNQDETAFFIENVSEHLNPEIKYPEESCIYIKRVVINDVGLFKEEINDLNQSIKDFFQKISNYGWQNIVDDSTYIYHNFGNHDEKNIDTKLSSHQIEKIENCIKLKAKNSDFSTPKKRVLYVLHENFHGFTGGTGQTTRDILETIDDIFECYILVSSGEKIVLWKREQNQIMMLKSWKIKSHWSFLEFYNIEFYNIYFNVLVSLNIDILHIHHLIGHTHDLPKVAKVLGIPIILSFHDFYYICPSIHLLDNKNRYCFGQCSGNKFECYTNNIFNHMLISTDLIDKWRKEESSLIDLCDAFIAPTKCTMDLFISIYPQLKTKNSKVIEHGLDLEKTNVKFQLPSKKKPIKILIPGNINYNKGHDFIKNLMENDHQNLIEFHFMGIIYGDLNKKGIYHGKYNNQDFGKIVNKIKPSFIGIFSIWPETYCRVLTEAWSCGIPVLATKMGALEERIEKDGGGWFLEHKSPLNSYDKIIQIANSEEEYLKIAEEIAHMNLKSRKEMVKNYEQLYWNLITKDYTF